VSTLYQSETSLVILLLRSFQPYGIQNLVWVKRCGLSVVYPTASWIMSMIIWI